MSTGGRLLIILGLGFVLTGIFLCASARIPWLGRLPGDVRIERQGLTFYAPFTTCLIASLVLSFVLRYFHK